MQGSLVVLVGRQSMLADCILLNRKTLKCLLNRKAKMLLSGQSLKATQNQVWSYSEEFYQLIALPSLLDLMFCYIIKLVLIKQVILLHSFEIF